MWFKIGNNTVKFNQMHCLQDIGRRIKVIWSLTLLYRKIVSEKSIFSPYKSVRDQIWPCRQIGQGQPRVIIWTTLVRPEYPMLHTKFQSHRPFGSREDFKSFYHIWALRPSWSMTCTNWIYFRSPIKRRLHMKFDLNRPSGYWGKGVWKYWIWVTLTKVNEWPRPVILIKLHVLIKLTLSTSFDIIDYNSFWKIHSFNVFPYKSIYGHGGHLGDVTRTIWTNIRSPIPRRIHIKCGFNRPSGRRGEDVWKCWQHTQAPSDDRGLQCTYSLL